MSQLQEEGIQSFGNGWKAIPGLGMGHVTNNNHQNATDNTAGTQLEGAQGQHTSDRETEFRGVKHTSAEFEEGELSEGETDDVYEPEEVDHVMQEEQQIEDVAAPMDISNSSEDERELSYSPRLSPQERQTGQASTESTDTSTSKPKSMEFTRVQALEMISRLWPLGMRFHHYVQEGIDRVVLQELFEELGLDINLTQHDSIIPVRDASRAAQRQNATDEPMQSHKNRTLAVSKPPTSSIQITDSSESRKDRIARLLAAKESKGPSKTTADDQGAFAKDANSTGSATPLASKPRADKSALLKEKMAALQAQRALRRAAKDREDADAPAKQIPQPTVAEAKASVGAKDTNFSSLSTHKQGKPSPSNIPGLSVPATSTIPTSNHSKRPVATDFGDFSATVSASIERSTDRVGELKPFLIHVSDDDSDAEMELDSPRPPSTQGKSPFEGSTFTNRPPVSNKPPIRELSTPGGAHTPSGASDHRSHPNLEHMTRKIKEMKRRIAEAEAKKRAKESLAESRTPNEVRTDDSRASSVGLSSGPSQPRSPATATVPTVGYLSGGDDRGRPISRTSQTKQIAAAELRRSRSRAASERIPHLEARRREQMLRLQVLQSQVASIEKEIAASKEEEARLKEDVWQPDERESASAQTPDTGATKEQSEAIPELSSITQSSKAGAGKLQGGEAGGTLQLTPARTDHAPNKSDVISALDGGDSVAATGCDIIRSSAETSSYAAPEVANSAVAAEPDTVIADAAESADPSIYEVLAESRHSEDQSDDDGDSSAESPGEIQSLDDEAAAEATALAEQDSDTIAGASLSRFLEVSEISEREVNKRPHPLQNASDELIASQATQGTSPKTENSTRPSEPSSSFQAYESPLSYFRAYRFHPEFKQNVTGGLRSLTYSNHVDVRNPLCPDELRGQPCPRGDKCQFQHFEMIQLPDDQILVQLGAAASLDEAQRQDYITGLRKLLTDFRSRKIRDFTTISDGIIAYRANFHGDGSKILPLGGTII